jgi:hypothetical protein
MNGGKSFAPTFKKKINPETLQNSPQEQAKLQTSPEG